MFFNSMKEMNGLRKEIKTLLIKECHTFNIITKLLSKKTDILKLRFSKFKKI